MLRSTRSGRSTNPASNEKDRWFGAYELNALGTPETMFFVNAVLALAQGVTFCVSTFMYQTAYPIATHGMVLGLSFIHPEEMPIRLLWFTLALVVGVEIFVMQRDTYMTLNFVNGGLATVQFVAFFIWTTFREDDACVVNELSELELELEDEDQEFERRLRRWRCMCGLDLEGLVPYVVSLAVALAVDAFGAPKLSYGYNAGPNTSAPVFVALVWYGRSVTRLKFHEKDRCEYRSSWFFTGSVSLAMAVYTAIIQTWSQTALLWSLVLIITTHGVFAEFF